LVTPLSLVTRRVAGEAKAKVLLHRRAARRHQGRGPDVTRVTQPWRHCEAESMFAPDSRMSLPTSYSERMCAANSSGV
jgi:hypothetical protein